ncbi:transposase family protein [Hymenobacter nivis]|uniref:transposase family protein n=1 Tax=Hymenobacter nivis TaxID=1850093 RepID=UPI0034DAE01F
MHARRQIPHKKPKDGERTKKQKRQNKAFRSKSVKIEHINRTCKCFRIVKETYRNRLNHIAQIWLIDYGPVNLSIEKVICI